MGKRIMRQFGIGEISGVDRPAQKGARMTIMKRADAWDDSDYTDLRKRQFSAEQRRNAESTGAAMPGGRYPIENKKDVEDAIKAVGRGKGSHAAIRAHIVRRARALGASDLIPDEWKSEKSAETVVLDAIDGAYELRKALKENITKAGNVAKDVTAQIGDASAAICTVFYEIADDASITDKAESMGEALAEFSEHVKRIAPEEIQQGVIAGAVEKAGFRITTKGGIELANEGADHMGLADIAKKLGLGADATEAQILKAMDDAKAKEKEDADKAKAESAKKAADLAKAYIDMSPVHKSYMGTAPAAPDGGWDAFALMDVAKRDEIIKKFPPKKPKGAGADDDDEDMEKSITKGDAFKTPEGVFVKRADFTSAAAFDLAKSQNITIAKQAEAIAKAEDTTAREAISKRITPLKNVGKTEEVVDMVRGVQKNDPKAAEAIIAKFEMLEGIVAKSALFNEAGSGQRGAVFGKAGETIQQKAEELRKSEPGKYRTIEKARDFVRQTNVELAKEEQREAAEKRRQAA